MVMRYRCGALPRPGTRFLYPAAEAGDDMRLDAPHRHDQVSLRDGFIDEYGRTARSDSQVDQTRQIITIVVFPAQPIQAGAAPRVVRSLHPSSGDANQWPAPSVICERCTPTSASSCSTRGRILGHWRRAAAIVHHQCNFATRITLHQLAQAWGANGLRQCTSDFCIQVRHGGERLRFQDGGDMPLIGQCERQLAVAPGNDYFVGLGHGIAYFTVSLLCTQPEESRMGSCKINSFPFTRRQRYIATCEITQGVKESS